MRQNKTAMPYPDALKGVSHGSEIVLVKTHERTPVYGYGTHMRHTLSHHITQNEKKCAQGHGAARGGHGAARGGDRECVVLRHLRTDTLLPQSARSNQVDSDDSFRAITCFTASRRSVSSACCSRTAVSTKRARSASTNRSSGTLRQCPSGTPSILG